MFKFFRQARGTLIKPDGADRSPSAASDGPSNLQGFTGRYLFYALGEIALVVIGILIALQINNWNERNKAKGNEYYILTELVSNLKEEGEQIKEMVQRREKALIAIDRLIGTGGPHTLEIDSFQIYTAQMMTNERFFPIKNAYEVSKANGLQITNKSLRTQIARYYEFEQQKVQQSIQDIERVFINQFEPILGSTNIVEGQYGAFVIFATQDNAKLFHKIYELAYSFRLNHRSSFDKIKLFAEKNKTLLREIQMELQAF